MKKTKEEKIGNVHICEAEVMSRWEWFYLTRWWPFWNSDLGVVILYILLIPGSIIAIGVMHWILFEWKI